jgi:hypothetical protein
MEFAAGENGGNHEFAPPAFVFKQVEKLIRHQVSHGGPLEPDRQMAEGTRIGRVPWLSMPSPISTTK